MALPATATQRATLRRRLLTERVKRLAREAGFHIVGVTSAASFEEAEGIIADRVRRGLMDGLPWYSEARARRGCRPRELLPEARSIISLGISYHAPDPPEPRDGAPRGRVSRYAWRRDYHRVFEGRLRELGRRLEALGGRARRAYVDYGPMPDRAVAARAGLGWFGKHTNLLVPGLGSWVFLAELLTDLDLEPDRPLRKTCGACATCIPACPTGAIPEPYVIDNTRCISYHTIENRGPIPRELRARFGDWVFGCDICQDVCPVNARARPSGDPEFAAPSVEAARPDLVRLLEMTEEEFERRYRGTAVRRARRVGLQRNACVALGNGRDPATVGPLRRALLEAEPLVRGHAAWALGRIGGSQAAAALREAAARERDQWVREEIAAALQDLEDVSRHAGAQAGTG